MTSLISSTFCPLSIFFNSPTHWLQFMLSTYVWVWIPPWGIALIAWEGSMQVHRGKKLSNLNEPWTLGTAIMIGTTRFACHVILARGGNAISATNCVLIGSKVLCIGKDSSLVLQIWPELMIEISQAPGWAHYYSGVGRVSQGPTLNRGAMESWFLMGKGS